MRTLGVDLGATWLRAALADECGQILKRWKIPAVRWTELPRAIKKMNPGKLERLTVGPTGVWKASDRTRLARSLRPLARKVRVISDVELAHSAAFVGRAGVLVIAGTGSIALARDGAGKFARAGGLGALLGDEGSGFWLGREALREPRLRRYFPESLALRLVHDEKPIRAIAALAPKVLALARRNSAARAIVKRGASHLAECALRARAELRLPRPTLIALHGTIFTDTAFRAEFLRRIGGTFVVESVGWPTDVTAARFRR